ncbi:MAG: hypothetical protein AAFX06_25485 [Planctomycetota bacterium]
MSSKILLSACVGLLLVFTTCTPTQASLIATDNFDSPGGWSDNRLSTISVLGNETIMGGVNVFGAGASTSQTFSLSGSQSSIDLGLRFFHFDSWDTGESFRIFLDGNLVYQRAFNQAVFGSDEVLFNEPGPVNRTDAYVDINLNYATTASNVTVTFTSTLDQPAFDESWGIDNFVLSDDLTTAAVPEPAGFAIFAGLSGVCCCVRRRR